MSKRMAWMLAVLAGIGLLILFDRPSATVPETEISQPSRRASSAMPEMKAEKQVLLADAAIPDLFADHAVATVSQQMQGDDGVKTKDSVAEVDFSLLGFKEENGKREAFLMRNGEVLPVAAGQLIEKRYRILSLQQDSVHIKDNQSGSEIRIGFKVNQ